MKRTLLTILLLLSLSWILPAIDLDLGLYAGMRTVNGDAVADVYGNGVALFPCVSAAITKELFAGLGYEFGYDRDGLIGIYDEEANLRVSGLEAFAGYRFQLGKVSPYLKLGIGNYAYRQTVSGVSRIDDSKLAPTLAAGARFQPGGKIFLAAEIKYVPLKVQPEDIEVDLGGWRLAAGVGYTFEL